MLGLRKFVYLDDETVDPREEKITQMLADAAAPEAEMAMIINDADAKLQANPKGLPNGFFLVQNPQGKRLGFGFFCKRCSLHIPGYAPAQVKHCGTVTELPKAIAGSTNRNAQREATKKEMQVKFSPVELIKAHWFWHNLKTVIQFPG